MCNNQVNKTLEAFLFTVESVSDILGANPDRREVVANQAAYLRGAVNEVRPALLGSGNEDPGYLIFIGDEILRDRSRERIIASQVECDYWVSRIAQLDPWTDVNYLMASSFSAE